MPQRKEQCRGSQPRPSLHGEEKLVAPHHCGGGGGGARHPGEVAGVGGERGGEALHQLGFDAQAFSCGPERMFKINVVQLIKKNVLTFFFK